jgi:nicotinate-nucleotide--dimethylbenzimidazole phosphoribosyltransferase
MSLTNTQLHQNILNKINNKTKPVGSLGQLETIAEQICLLQQTLEPQIKKPTVVVFAGDHGVAAQGKVNPYPQSVTAQMVLNFVTGGAAINVFCKQNNIDLMVVDAGVNYQFDAATPILHYKAGMGTADYTAANAITKEQLTHCQQKAYELVSNLQASGCNTIAFGEMGIGNTSSASLLMHYYTGIALQNCVGRGTGASNEQLNTKLQTLQQAASFHKVATEQITATELLQRIGGFEIAMMAYAYLRAQELNMLIVVDGFIATAALLSAIHLLNAEQHTNQNMHQSPLLKHCVFAHCSHESGHQSMLQHLQAEPLLRIGLRLGEGTGAALAMPLIQSACAFINQMASFETAGVSNKN